LKPLLDKKTPGEEMATTGAPVPALTILAIAPPSEWPVLQADTSRGGKGKEGEGRGGIVAECKK
jgi:hypothetical protein